MNKLTKITLFSLILLFFPAVFGYDIYYGNYNQDLFTRYVDFPVVAASNDYSMGILGQVRIGLLEGQEKIIFDSRTNIDDTTLISVLDAVRFAEHYTNKQGSYFISYDLNTDSVSGKSTGGSVSLGIISLLLDQDYNKDYVVTGGVDGYGYLQETGGIPIKIMAVNTQKPYLIIPKGQGTTTISEKMPVFGSYRYMAKEFDLVLYSREKYDLHLIEAEKITELIPFIIQKL